MPNCLKNSSKVVGIAPVQLQRGGLLAHLLDFGHDGIGFVLLAVVGQQHITALSRQAKRHILTQAATTARDEYYFGFSHNEN